MRGSGLLLALLLAVVSAGCFGGAAPVRLKTTCHTPDGACVTFRQAVNDADGAPLPRGTLIALFTGAVRVPDPPAGLHVVTAATNLETGAAELRLAPVRAIQSDPRNDRQLLIEIDGLPADGAALDLPDGVVRDGHGKGLGPVRVPLHTGVTPLAAALAGVVWEPADRTLFGREGLEKPRGTKDQAAVRRELEARLRLRPGLADEQVGRVLAQYDGEALRAKVPDHRVRAGLLLLTGTSAEFAIQYLQSDTNRLGTPFAPVEVQPIFELGAFAAVFHGSISGRLRMVLDTDMAGESLENIAVVLAHETLHSSLGFDSASQEMLAMAAQTRVYEELLIFDPDIARSPTAFTRQQNMLTLALRNSGRFGFPRAGILPRPGVDDALRGLWRDGPVASFKDLAFHPDVYGDLRRGGDSGSEVLEAYYRAMAELSGDQGRMPFDDATLKRFDEVLDSGFTDAQIVAITAALALRPVPVTR